MMQLTDNTARALLLFLFFSVLLYSGEPDLHDMILLHAEPLRSAEVLEPIATDAQADVWLPVGEKPKLPDCDTVRSTPDHYWVYRCDMGDGAVCYTSNTGMGCLWMAGKLF